MGIIIFSMWKFSSLRVQEDRKIGTDKDGRTYEVDELGNRVYEDGTNKPGAPEESSETSGE
jgi:hypothetical protein